VKRVIRAAKTSTTTAANNVPQEIPIDGAESRGGGGGPTQGAREPQRRRFKMTPVPVSFLYFFLCFG